MWHLGLSHASFFSVIPSICSAAWNVRMSLSIILCLSVVFKTFSAILLLRTTHSVKDSQTVGKSCKIFSANILPPQEWGFPPKIHLKTPHAPPTAWNILGKTPLRTGCLYVKTIKCKLRPSRVFAVGLHSGGCARGSSAACAGNSVMNTTMKCWNWPSRYSSTNGSVKTE